MLAVFCFVMAIVVIAIMFIMGIHWPQHYMPAAAEPAPTTTSSYRAGKRAVQCQGTVVGRKYIATLDVEDTQQPIHLQWISSAGVAVESDVRGTGGFVGRFGNEKVLCDRGHVVVVSGTRAHIYQVLPASGAIEVQAPIDPPGISLIADADLVARQSLTMAGAGGRRVQYTWDGHSYYPE